LIVDGCYLDASSENILFGGGDPAREEDIPSDILIRRCTLTKPVSWRSLPDANVKNLFELKNAKRVTLEECDLSFSWVQGQDGFAILLTVRNQDGNAPWSTIEDVTIRGCTVRHAAGGVQILGSDYTYPSGRMTRVRLLDNVFCDLGPDWGWNGRSIQIEGGDDLEFVGNSFRGIVSCGFYFIDGYASPCRGFVVRNHDMDEGDYGICADGGLLGMPALEKHAPDINGRTSRFRRGTR
jgi:hypothetical protein